MNFEDLQRRLVEELRWRVNNGEVTERGLARYVGISQPHIHKVLKGSKILSTKYCDRILSALSLSLFDLAEPFDAEEWLRQRRRGRCDAVTLRVLAGRLGPGEPWPEATAGRASFALHPDDVAGFRHPVAAQLAADPRMKDAIYDADWVVLDQNPDVRRQVEPDALYLIRQNGAALVRRVALAAGKAYIVAEDVRRNPGRWEEAPVAQTELPRLVRARVHPITPVEQWPSRIPEPQPPCVRATSR
jgi:hypothetical protein